MLANSVKQFLPSIQNDQKIEVLLENDNAVIKLSTWTENLGWCCQKTLRLESGLLDDLHHLLTAARYKLNQQKAENNEFSTSKVLEFPAVAA